MKLVRWKKESEKLLLAIYWLAKKHFFAVNENMLCAKAEGKDTCQVRTYVLYPFKDSKKQRTQNRNEKRENSYFSLFVPKLPQDQKHFFLQLCTYNIFRATPVVPWCVPDLIPIATSWSELRLGDMDVPTPSILVSTPTCSVWMTSYVAHLIIVPIHMYTSRL